MVFARGNSNIIYKGYNPYTLETHSTNGALAGYTLSHVAYVRTVCDAIMSATEIATLDGLVSTSPMARPLTSIVLTVELDTSVHQ